jgi:DNA-binding NtrC family response regulator
MKNVLFVDDDAMVLRALERTLRSARKDWRMVFALGPSAALATLEAESFDAVVSDLGMAGMDGAEVLARVRAKQPKAVRILLSGDVGAAMARAKAVADEILTKPCGASDLTACLTRHFETPGHTPSP